MKRLRHRVASRSVLPWLVRRAMKRRESSNVTASNRLWVPDIRPWRADQARCGCDDEATRASHLVPLPRVAWHALLCVLAAPKIIEIIVLRHQLMVLRRPDDRPELDNSDRSLLGAIAHALPRPRRMGWLVTPDTLLRWHRQRIARYWTQPTRGPGRPSTTVEIRRLIIDMATDNPTWGYRRISGEFTGLGHDVGASTVWRILKRHGINPAPQRCAVTWTQFLRSQAAVAC